MQKLFEKGKKIMNIFWSVNKPCLISDILNIDSSLSRNTVAKALVTLEKKGFLKVDSIRRTVTRTGRAYIPVVSKKEYELQQSHIQAVTEGNSISQNALSLFSTLLQSDCVEDDFIDQLEAMISDYKNGKE